MYIMCEYIWCSLNPILQIWKQEENVLRNHPSNQYLKVMGVLVLKSHR